MKRIANIRDEQAQHNPRAVYFVDERNLKICSIAKRDERNEFERDSIQRFHAVRSIFKKDLLYDRFTPNDAYVIRYKNTRARGEMRFTIISRI